MCDLYLFGVSGMEVIECVVCGDYGMWVVIVLVLEDGFMFKWLFEVGVFGYIGKVCDV